MSAECGTCGTDIVYPEGTWLIGECPSCSRDVEISEMRDALIRIEAFAGELEGRHTGFVHVGRMARLALRRYDRKTRGAA